MIASKLDWNKIFEFTWRILVFIVAGATIFIVSTRWTRWEGRAGWQLTNDAYLQSDLTPIAAKVAGYVRDVPVQDYDRVHAGQVIVQLVDDDYRAAVAQGEAHIAAAHAVVASTEALSEQNARDLARQRRLFETGSSSTEAAEKLETQRAQLAA